MTNSASFIYNTTLGFLEDFGFLWFSLVTEKQKKIHYTFTVYHQTAKIQRKSQACEPSRKTFRTEQKDKHKPKRMCRSASTAPVKRQLCAKRDKSQSQRQLLLLIECNQNVVSGKVLFKCSRVHKGPHLCLMFNIKAWSSASAMKYA